MTIRIDQISKSIISAPGTFVKVSGSLGGGSNIIINNNSWVQFFPRAGFEEFYIPLSGNYKVDLDFLCSSISSEGSGVFSFKIIIDEGESNEIEIGNTDDWRYRTSSSSNENIQNHFSSNCELISGKHTLQIYGKRIDSSSSGQIEILGDTIEGVSRAVSVIFQNIAGSGAGGVLLKNGYLEEDFSVTSIYPIFEDVGLSCDLETSEESIFLTLVGKGEKNTTDGTIWVRFVVEADPIPDLGEIGQYAISSEVVNLSNSVFTPTLEPGHKVVKIQAATDVGTAKILKDTHLYVAQYRGGLVPIQHMGQDIVGQPRALNFEGSGISVFEDIGVANIAFFPDSQLPLLRWENQTRVDILIPFNEGSAFYSLQDGKRRELLSGLFFDPSVNLDEGTEEPNSWYYIYVVPKNSNDDLLEIIGSLNSIDVGPVGKDNYKYIGAVRNNSVGDIIRFYQSNNIFNYAHKIKPEEINDLIVSNFYDPAVIINISDSIPKTSISALLNFNIQKDDSATDKVYGELFIDGYVDEITTSIPSEYYFDYITTSETSFDSEQKNITLPTPKEIKKIGYRVFKDFGSGIGVLNHSVFVNGWVDGYLSNNIMQSMFSGQVGTVGLDESYDRGNEIFLKEGKSVEVSIPVDHDGYGLEIINSDAGSKDIFLSGSNTEHTIYSDKSILIESLDGYVRFNDSYLSCPIGISEPGETGLIGFDANSVVGAINELNSQKQDVLVSGDNIKTINSESLLGSGNIIIEGSGSVYSGVAERNVGGITSGDIFTNATMTEMWDKLIKEEKFPILTSPSSTFTSSQTGFKEVGEILSITFNSSFNRGSINPQYTAESPYRSGLPNEYQFTGTNLVNQSKTDLTDSQSISGYTVVVNAQSWQGRVSYDGGVQPKSSYDNDYSTPLTAGTTSYITRTITGVYPYFATTSNITTLTKQTLASMTSTYVEVTMVAESGGEKQKIEFPDVWSAISGIQFFNTVSSAWEWINGSKVNSLLTFTTSSVTNTIQGNVINYTRFTHNGANIGSRQLRFYTN